MSEFTQTNDFKEWLDEVIIDKDNALQNHTHEKNNALRATRNKLTGEWTGGVDLELVESDWFHYRDWVMDSKTTLINDDELLKRMQKCESSYEDHEDERNESKADQPWGVPA